VVKSLEREELRAR